MLAHTIAETERVYNFYSMSCHTNSPTNTSSNNYADIIYVLNHFSFLWIFFPRTTLYIDANKQPIIIIDHIYLVNLARLLYFSSLVVGWRIHTAHTKKTLNPIQIVIHTETKPPTDFVRFHRVAACRPSSVRSDRFSRTSFPASPSTGREAFVWLQQSTLCTQLCRLSVCVCVCLWIFESLCSSRFFIDVVGLWMGRSMYMYISQSSILWWALRVFVTSHGAELCVWDFGRVFRLGWLEGYFR